MSTLIFDLSDRLCSPHKTNICVKVFVRYLEKNESKTFIKHISCDSRCKFDRKKYSFN